jgi:antitoxin component YwqK of YwqJK toxin-antitoxin module
MKNILTILICVSSLNTFAQKLVKTYWDYYNTKIQSEYYTDAYGTKTGAYKGYSEHGGILLQGSYKDNAPIGKWTENYLDGKLHFIKFYTSPGYTNFDVVDGKIISYYEDGKTIKSEKNYKNHELDGDYKSYDERGALTGEGKYINGVFERTGESKRIYDEEQEKQKQATLIKNTEEYKKNITEADKALVAKEYKKALEFYESAANLMKDEKYPKDKIAEMINPFIANSEFFNEFFKTQNDTLVKDFNTLKADFKIKSIKEYNRNTYAYDDKKPTASSYYCDCLAPWNEPWNEQSTESVIKCFEINKAFYEPYQRAITEAFFKYRAALIKEENKVRSTDVRFYSTKMVYQFYTYDKTTLLNNLKVEKENFEFGKSLKTNYLKAVDNKVNITNLNDQNKKKTLLKKYLIVYEDFIFKINAYPGLTETISLLKSLNSISDKVVALYSQETKDMEKKLKDAETSEQIQAMILGQ